MKWELGALEILAREKTVPGLALQDAISEIKALRVKLASKEIIIKNQQRRINELAEKLLAKGEEK